MIEPNIQWGDILNSLGGTPTIPTAYDTGDYTLQDLTPEQQLKAYQIDALANLALNDYDGESNQTYNRIKEILPSKAFEGFDSYTFSSGIGNRRSKMKHAVGSGRYIPLMDESDYNFYKRRINTLYNNALNSIIIKEAENSARIPGGNFEKAKNAFEQFSPNFSQNWLNTIQNLGIRGVYNPVENDLQVFPQEDDEFLAPYTVPDVYNGLQLKNIPHTVRHELEHWRQSILNPLWINARAWNDFVTYVDPKTGMVSRKRVNQKDKKSPTMGYNRIVLGSNLDSLIPMFARYSPVYHMSSPSEFAADFYAFLYAMGANSIKDLSEDQYEELLQRMAAKYPIYTKDLDKYPEHAYDEIEHAIKMIERHRFEKGGAVKKLNYLDYFKSGSKINIKKSHKGLFTSYCKGKVTEDCIRKGKASKDPAIRKRAVFAENARKFKH